MTIIVFDGKVMAADRAAWSGSTCYPTRKVFRFERHRLAYARGAILVGIAGHAGYAHEVLRWIQEGGDKPPVPESQKGYATALVVDQRRRIWLIQSDGLTPTPVEARRATFGAPIAEAMAMGCLLMGASARTAVRAVIKYTDVASLGVQTVNLR